MDYQLEEKAFYSRLEFDPLCDSAIALWHALRVISMVVGRAEGLSIPQGVLCAKAGTSPSGLKRARDQLVSKGLISWKSRGKERATLYTLLSACQYDTHSGIHSATHSGIHSATHSGTHSEPLYYTTQDRSVVDITDQYGTHSATHSGMHSGMHSANEEGQADTQARTFLSEDEMEAMRERQAALDEVEGKVRQLKMVYDFRRLELDVTKYSAAWVMEALNRAQVNAKGVPSWKYVYRILDSWLENGSQDAPSAAGAREAVDEQAQKRQKIAEMYLRGEIPK